MTDDNEESPLFSAAFNEIEVAAAVQSITSVLGNLRKELTANGFTREEALLLCNTWLSAVTLPRGRKQ